MPPKILVPIAKPGFNSASTVPHHVINPVKPIVKFVFVHNPEFDNLAK